MDFVWEKPVIMFFKDRSDKPEKEPFVVVKTRRLEISKVDKKELEGSIHDFFPLMGNVSFISSNRGFSDRYILCWLDDAEDDFKKGWRRLSGVIFTEEFTSLSDENGKKTYNAHFRAEHGKLG